MIRLRKWLRRATGSRIFADRRSRSREAPLGEPRFIHAPTAQPSQRPEELEDRTLLSGNSFATATLLTLPESGVLASIDQIDSNSEFDFWAVDLSAGDIVQAAVESQSLGSTLDSVLTVVNPFGQVIARNDDRSATTRDSAATIEAATDGIHFFVVSNAGFGSTGDYVLNTFFDIGDSVATSVGLTASALSASTVTAGIELPHDRDVITIDLIEGTEVHVSIDAQTLGSPLDSVLTVFDPSFGVAAFNDDRTPQNPDSATAFTPQSTGTYFIVIQSAGASTVGNYRLAVTVDVGDSAADATPVSVTSVAPGIVQSELSSPQDVDVFSIELQAGDVIQARVLTQEIGSPLDSVVRVRSPELSLIADNDDILPGVSTGSAATIVAAIDGIYFVEVLSADAVTSGVYELQVFFDVGDNPETAEEFVVSPETPAEIPSLVEHEFDRDVFSVVLEEGNVIHFAVLSDTLGSTLDSELRLLTSAFEEVASSTDVLNGVDDSAIDFYRIPESGRYFVEVRSENFSTSGPYVLRAFHDVGGSLSSAQQLSDVSELPVTLDSAIDLTHDIDRYLVDLDAGQTVQVVVETQTIGSSLDGIVAVLDPDGDLVDFSDDAVSGTTDSAVTFSPSISGQYSISLHSAGFVSSGPYRLRVFEDVGNTQATSTLLTLSPAAHTVVPSEVDARYDVDVFAVDLLSGDVVQAVVESHSIGSPLDSFLQVRDGQNNLLFQNDDISFGSSARADNLDSTTTFKVPEDGRYFFSVFSSGFASSGMYNFRVFHDVGNTPQTGMRIDLESDGHTTIESTIDVTHDLDFFTIDLEAGQTIQAVVEVGSIGSDLDSFVGVFGPAQNLIVSNSDATAETNDSAVTFRAAAEGTYAIAVASAGFTTAGPYTLRVFEDVGGTVATATHLELETDGQVSIESAIDVTHDFDFFTVELEVGQTIQAVVEVGPVGTGLDSFVAIFGPDQSLLASNIDAASGTDDSAVTFRAAVAGIYTIGVASAGLSTTGTYTLRVFEDVGATQATSSVLLLNRDEQSVVSGQVDVRYDVDVFAVDLLEGDVVQAVAESHSIGSPLDSFLQVRDDQNNLLFQNDDVSFGSPVQPDNLDSSITFRVPADGRYFFSVFSSGLASSGDYNFIVFHDVGTDAETRGALSTVTAAGTGTSGAIDVALDVDTFAVTLERGTFYEFLVSSQEALRPRFFITTEDGTAVTTVVESDASRRAGLTFIFEESATYLIHILGTDETLGSYDLQVSEDIGDAIVTALVIASPNSEPVPVASHISDVADVDFFLFGATEGTILNVELFDGAQTQGLDAGVRLFDSSGRELAFGTGSSLFEPGYVGSGVALSYRVPVTDVYYVGVSAHSNLSYSPVIQSSSPPVRQSRFISGDYALRVSFAGAIDRVGDSIVTAETLTPQADDFLQTESRIETDNDVDLYSVELQEGDVLFAAMDAVEVASTLDPFLRIFDDGGTELVATDVSAGTDPRLSFVAPHSGTYFVGVSSSRNRFYDITDPRETRIVGEFDGRIGLGAIFRLGLGRFPRSVVHETLSFDETVDTNLSAGESAVFTITAQESGLVSVFASDITRNIPAADVTISLLAVGSEDILTTGSASGPDDEFARIDTILAPGSYLLIVDNLSASDGVVSLSAFFSARTLPATPIFTGPSPSSLVTGDFNADGFADFAVSDSREHTVQIYYGKGDGTFSPAESLSAGLTPVVLLAADMDRDGDEDVLSVNARSSDVTLILDTPDGSTATSIFVGGTPTAIAAIDVDRNGVLDLIVTDEVSSGLVVVLDPGEETESRHQLTLTSGPASSVLVADLDADGLPEGILTHTSSPQLTLLGTDESGQLQQRHIALPNVATTVTTVDVLDDGVVDIAVTTEFDAEDGPTVTILSPTESGDYTVRDQYAGFFEAEGVTNVHLNGDEYEDLVTLDSNGIALVYVGTETGTFLPPNAFRVGVSTSAIAYADFDGDSLIDGAVADVVRNEVRILRSDGAAGFGTGAQADIALLGATPAGISAGDFDLNGTTDLVAADFNGRTVSFVPSNGDGSFGRRVDHQVTFLPASIATGDINGDGRPDVVAAGQVGMDTSGMISVLLGTGAGRFSEAVSVSTSHAVSGVSLGDFNDDGRLDIVVVNTGTDDTPGNSVIMLRQTDGFSFEVDRPVEVGSSPDDVVSADIDGDGKLDVLLTAHGSNEIWVLYGDGDGGFDSSTIIATEFAARSPVPLDVNGNGLLDIAFVEPERGLLRQLTATGRRTFTEGPAVASSSAGTGQSPSVVVAADVDQDGRDELLVVNLNYGSIREVTVFEVGNSAAPEFATFRHIPTGSAGRSVGGESVVISDLDRDGKVDVVLSEFLQPAAFVLLNDTSVSGSVRLQNGTDNVSDLRRNDPSFVDFNFDGILDLLAFDLRGRLISRVGLNPRDVLFSATFAAEDSAGIAVNEATGEFVPFVLDGSGRNLVQTELVDVDGDGVDDLVQLVTAPARLFVEFRGAESQNIVLPVGSESFAVRESGPAAVVIDDFDNDGKRDFAVANARSGDVFTFIQTEPRQFESMRLASTGLPGQRAVFSEDAVSSTISPADIESGDFDFDGVTDLLVGHSDGDILTLFRGNGDGRFREPLFGRFAGTVARIVSRDVNRDGVLDLVTVSADRRSISVFRGSGPMLFTRTSQFEVDVDVTGINVVDINRDGLFDLALSSAEGDVFYRLGDGRGRFDDVQRANTGTLIHVADLDGDGVMDTVTASAASDQVTVTLSRSEDFVQVNDDGIRNPSAVVVEDLDADGFDDLVVANAESNLVFIYRGADQGRFLEPDRLFTGANPSGVTVEDVDADGRLDLIVANRGSNTAAVYLGQTAVTEASVTERIPFSAGGVSSVDSGAGPVSTGLSDVNGDGISDLVVTNADAGTVSFFTGDGTGLFGAAPANTVPIGQTADQGGVVVGNQFFAPNPGEDSLIIIPDLSATFTTGSGVATIESLGIDPVFALPTDFNLDGVLDLVVANNGDGSVVLFAGFGGGFVFDDLLQDPNLAHPSGMDIAVVDGVLNLFVTDEGEDVATVFRLQQNRRIPVDSDEFEDDAGPTARGILGLLALVLPGVPVEPAQEPPLLASLPDTDSYSDSTFGQPVSWLVGQFRSVLNRVYVVILGVSPDDPEAAHTRIEIGTGLLKSTVEFLINPTESILQLLLEDGEVEDGDESEASPDSAEPTPAESNEGQPNSPETRASRATMSAVETDADDGQAARGRPNRRGQETQSGPMANDRRVEVDQYFSACGEGGTLAGDLFDDYGIPLGTESRPAREDGHGRLSSDQIAEGTRGWTTSPMGKDLTGSSTKSSEESQQLLAAGIAAATFGGRLAGQSAPSSREED